MAKVRFKYEGNFKKTEAAIKKALKESVGDTAEAVVREISGAAPVDTGELRDSISSEVISDTEARVGAKAKHAPFVEFGTSRMKAQPFFKSGGQRGAESFGTILKRNIKKNL